MEEDNMSDLINTFKNMLNNNNSNQEKSPNNDSNLQNSNLNITPDMISNLITNFNNSSNNNGQKKENSSEFANNIDIDTIIKIKSIVEKLNNKDDPRAKLLYSLKPYLRESRKKKIDQYVNLLKITSISDLFKNRKWR